jgi:Chaperone of endosialidase
MAMSLRTIAASAAFAAACLTSNQIAAMPIIDPAGVRGALDRIEVTDRVQYTYQGRGYCWYDNGWNGPGWYVCGQYRTRGVGWGGAAGWRGWTVRGGAVRGGAVRGGAVRGGAVRAGGGRVSGGRVSGGRAGGGRGGRRSDIALKHDIMLLGRLDNGLGFYRFSYSGSDRAYVGVMAQEVQAVTPQAVLRGTDGYLQVRYDMLGLKFQTYEQWLASGAHVPSGRAMRH